MDEATSDDKDIIDENQMKVKHAYAWEKRMKRIRNTLGMKLLITAFEIAFIVLVVLGIIFLLQQAGYAEDEAKYVMCMDRVNIRLGASTKTDAIGWLEPGDVVYPDGKIKNGFVHCEIPSIEAGEGWVKKGYLVDDKPKRVDRNATVISNGKLAARKNVKGKRTRWLKPGGELLVYYWSEDWCLTNCGYVQSQYLELDGD